MKCLAHPETEANAICIHCGRSLCAVCSVKSVSGRNVCSLLCASALQRSELALNSINVKSQKNMSFNGYAMLAFAFVFTGFGIFTVFDRIWQIALIVFPMALVFVITGIVFIRAGRKKEQAASGVSSTQSRS